MRANVPKLLTLLAISVLCGMVFSWIALHFCSWLFDVPLNDINSALQSLNTEKEKAITKIIVFFNSTGIFILPAILYAFYFHERPSSFLKVNNIGAVSNYGLTLLILISFLPLLNVFVAFNKAMNTWQDAHNKH